MFGLGFHYEELYTTKYMAASDVAGTFILFLLLTTLLCRAIYDFVWRPKKFEQHKKQAINSNRIVPSQTQSRRDSNHGSTLTREVKPMKTHNNDNPNSRLTPTMNNNYHYNDSHSDPDHDRSSGPESEMETHNTSDHRNNYHNHSKLSPNDYKQQEVSTTSSTVYTATNDDTQQDLELKDKNKLKRKQSKIRKITKIRNTIKMLFFSSLVFSILYAIMSFLVMSLYIFFDLHLFYCADRSILIVFYALQRVSLMFFFIARLHHTFKNTIFRIQRKFIMLFVIVTVIFYTGVVIWYIVTAYVTEHDFVCDMSYLVFPAVTTGVMDILWNLFLGVFFQRKLKSVHSNLFNIKTQKSRIIEKNNNNNDKNKLNNESKTMSIKYNSNHTNQSKSQLSQTQIEKMQTLVRKLFILLAANVSISSLCLVLWGFSATYTIPCIDMLTANLCLWLSYKFNIKLYEKLCKPCIACLYVCDRHCNSH